MDRSYGMFDQIVGNKEEERSSIILPIAYIIIFSIIAVCVFIVLRCYNKKIERSSSFSMSDEMCYNNLGYGANETETTSKYPLEYNINEMKVKSHEANLEEDKQNKRNSIKSSASQYSLNSFVSNKNISRVFIEQKNLIMNYSILVNEKQNVVTLNIISLENLRSSNTMDWKIIDNLCVYILIEMRFTDKDGNQVNKTARTRLIKNRANPVFDETFEFDLFQFTDKNAINQGLFFYVCNSNSFGRDQLLGEHTQGLHADDLINEENNLLRRMFSKKVTIINPKAYNESHLGQLHYTLCFKKAANSIYLNIQSGKDLKMSKIYLNSEKVPSAFVKIYLLYKGHCIQKHETRIVKKSANPIFNESFKLELNDLFHSLKTNDDVDSIEAFKGSVLSELQIFLLIMDNDKIEKTDAIGKIQLNSRDTFMTDKTDSELNLNEQWFHIFEVADQPKEFIQDITNF